MGVEFGLVTKVLVPYIRNTALEDMVFRLLNMFGDISICK